MRELLLSVVKLQVRNCETKTPTADESVRRGYNERGARYIQDGLEI